MALDGYATRDGAPREVALCRPKPIPSDPGVIREKVRRLDGPLRPAKHNVQPLGVPGGGAEKKPFRPAFWDSKLWGEPHGEFERTVQDEHGRKRTSARGPAPSNSMAKRTEKISDAMVAAIRRKRTLHGGERGLLMSAFRAVDDACIGTVSPATFRTMWKLLGVYVSIDEAEAMFNRFGRDKDGRLPYEVFVSALLAGRSKVLGMMDVVQGPFQAASLHKVDWTNKIVYPHCRSAVLAPSGFNPQLARRSAQLPRAALRLEFVTGYNGLSCFSPNLFYTAAGEAVYPVAGVGVVYDTRRHSQRFFRGHTDDVTCLSLHPDMCHVATGQLGRDPRVLIWDSSTCQTVACLDLGSGQRGVAAVGFSPSGKRLVSVSMDNQHTVVVWGWKAARMVCQGKGYNGTPPQVYGVIWNPSGGGDEEFVTYGVNHLKEWRRHAVADKEYYESRMVSYNQVAHPFTILCVCFLPSGVLLAGAINGNIATFKGGKLRQLVPAHADLGSKPIGGVPSSRGLRCLRLLDDQKTLLSGGADGRILWWDVSSGTLGPQLRSVSLACPLGADTGAALKVRGLDWRPGRHRGEGTLIVGTTRCDVWEIDEKAGSSDVLIFGHSSDLHALCVNPAKHAVFATAALDDRVYVWDARRRRLLRTTSLGKEAGRALAWSPDGKHLAVGMVSGGVKVLDANSLEPLVWKKERSFAIEVMRYSPDNRWLAVGSHDCFIDIHDVRRDYKRVARCNGHAATIRHLDWSTDSSALMSNCSAYEVLHWDPTSGRQLRQSQRDTDWQSWTSISGFPVMGMWMQGSDGSDINSCCRSNSREFLVTADDFGHVRLLNYPCVTQHAPPRTYSGHSSHVACVRFLPGDQRVVSIGGTDRALFQWRTHAMTCSNCSGPPNGGGSSGVAELDEPRPACEIEDCPVCGRGSNVTGPIRPRAPWDGGERG